MAAIMVMRLMPHSFYGIIPGMCGILLEPTSPSGPDQIKRPEMKALGQHIGFFNPRIGIMAVTAFCKQS